MKLTNWRKLTVCLESGRDISIFVTAEEAARYMKEFSTPPTFMFHLAGVRATPIVQCVEVCVVRKLIVALEVEDAPHMLNAVKCKDLEAVADGSEILVGNEL